MYTVSELFKRYIDQPDREFDRKVDIAGTEYPSSSIVSFSVEDSVVSSESFTLGEVISSCLTLFLKTVDTAPVNAQVTPYVRLNGDAGWTEWVPLGVFYIDSRSYEDGGVVSYVCYDRLILSNQLFVSALTYPVAMSSVMSEIATQLSVTLDDSVVINPAYEIPYKDEDITIHDMIGFIACAHCASAKMTKDGKLAFVVYAPLVIADPTVVSVETDIEGQIVTVTFSKNMANPVGRHSEFSLKVDGVSASFSSCALQTNRAKVDFYINGNVAEGDVLLLSYTRGTIDSTDGGELQSFTDLAVTNNSLAEVTVLNVENIEP